MAIEIQNDEGDYVIEPKRLSGRKVAKLMGILDSMGRVPSEEQIDEFFGYIEEHLVLRATLDGEKIEDDLPMEVAMELVSNHPDFRALVSMSSPPTPTTSASSTDMEASTPTSDTPTGASKSNSQNASAGASTTSEDSPTPNTSGSVRISED